MLLHVLVEPVATAAVTGAGATAHCGNSNAEVVPHLHLACVWRHPVAQAVRQVVLLILSSCGNMRIAHIAVSTWPLRLSMGAAPAAWCRPLQGSRSCAASTQRATR